jgi:mono/diheme cytochrome c family protein
MVIDDWAAPWKPYQREFRRMDADRTEQQLVAMEDAAAEEARLSEALVRAQEAFGAREAELAEAEAELAERKGRRWNKDQEVKAQKGVNAWDTYIADGQIIHGDTDLAGATEILNEGRKRQFELQKEFEVLDAAVVEQEEVIASITMQVTAIEKELKDATKGLKLHRSKLERMRPTKASEKVANVVRDFPGLDFVGPNLKVEKVVCPEIQLDLNFIKRPRIDMCMTCHAGIDRPGFEDEEQPYSTHPRLDLFLTATSPHPMNRMGCTVCHRGDGESLDFQAVDHRPTDAEEDERWHDEYHWHKQHHWDWPMLSSEHIEASCVQCHTSSMELIAEDAPRLTEGYRLFEDSGCYSCHKVEWFPTTRRRGPTLRNLMAKLEKPWLDEWIARPRSFRPDTRMPQIFHLENHSAETLIVKSEYGQGRDMMGDEWSDSAVAAVSAYLVDSAPPSELPEPPVDGDPDAGREEFRLVGCAACHDVQPWDDETETFDLAERPGRYSDMGPSLRGVATKLDANWLYWWIKDPSSYWSETRMPNLRLTDQQAADIAAYMTEDPDGFFTDTPEGWEPKESPFDRDVLVEQARWLYSTLGRTELARRLEGEWSTDEALLVAVGEKMISHQGCFSCHEINGMEAAQPIGTELTRWGSKTVDKLDFGFLQKILAEEHGWDHHTKTQFKKYREGWLGHKLANPRVFDRQKFKNPLDRLRMPDFGFDEDEITALTTFLVGMVNDDVRGAAMTPDADQSRMDAGMRAVRQKNCAACHVLEPGRITFTDEDGERRTVSGELLAFEDETQPPPMHGFDEYLAETLEYYREDDEEFDIEEVYVRLLETEPGLGDVGDTIGVPTEDLLVEAGWGGDFVRLVTDAYLWGFNEDGEIRDADGEVRVYSDEQYDKLRWTFAPPVLTGEGSKLQTKWFYGFLADPVTLRPQMRVRMPSFHWADGEAGAVVDWFALEAARRWPARYTRRLRHALDLSLESLADGVGVTPAILAAIENGSKPDTEANFARVLAYGESRGFAPAPSTEPANRHPSDPDADEPAFSPWLQVDAAHERIRRRDVSHVDALLEGHPTAFSDADGLARGGPNCFQCHFYRGAPPLDGEALPIAWAPDLARVHERIREDWAHQWIKDPARIYPGTAMPANFAAEPPAYQELLEDSSNEDQIQLILDWLYNMDRLDLRN